MSGLTVFLHCMCGFWSCGCIFTKKFALVFLLVASCKLCEMSVHHAVIKGFLSIWRFETWTITWKIYLDNHWGFWMSFPESNMEECNIVGIEGKQACLQTTIFWGTEQGSANGSSEIQICVTAAVSWSRGIRAISKHTHLGEKYMVGGTNVELFCVYCIAIDMT